MIYESGIHTRSRYIKYGVIHLPVYCVVEISSVVVGISDDVESSRGIDEGISAPVVARRREERTVLLRVVSFRDALH